MNTHVTTLVWVRRLLLAAFVIVFTVAALNAPATAVTVLAVAVPILAAYAVWTWDPAKAAD